MTLTTLLAQCRVWLQDNGTSPMWTDAMLTQWINDGQLDFAIKTRILPAVASPVFSSGALYTLPTDAIDLHRVELSGVELARVTSQELALFYGGNWTTVVTTTSPATATHSFTYEEFGPLTIRIFPSTAATVASSLKCYYWRTPATLSGSAIPDIPVPYHIKLVDYAVARAYLMDVDQRNPERAKLFMDSYDAQVAALTQGGANVANS